MEPAKIDWNRIHSRFVEDYVYEHINAPKWVDFLTLDHHSIDDNAWFCTPDCNHPKTAEDFLQASPLSKAPRRSVTGGGNRCSPFRELNQGAEDAAVENERMPLVELGQEKPVVMQKGIGIAKEKEKIKKSITQEEDAENMASPLSLNLENVKSKDKEGLLQIRTNPPSPQCFSAPFKTTTLLRLPDPESWRGGSFKK